MITKAVVKYNEAEKITKEINFKNEMQSEDAAGFQLPNHGDSGAGHWAIQKDGKAVLVGITKGESRGLNLMMRITDPEIMKFIKEYANF